MCNFPTKLILNLTSDVGKTILEAVLTTWRFWINQAPFVIDLNILSFPYLLLNSN